jgi:HEAT repeat protein
MTRFFSKLFNIRPAEWPHLLFLYLIFFLYITGATWGETIVEAAFLQQVGVSFLPWVFVAIALLSVPTTAIYTAFADRISNNTLAIAILIMGVTGIGVGRLLLAWDLDHWAYPVLYLIMFVPLSDIFITHWYTLVNGFYDTQSAKRIIPILSTATRIGGILAGLTMFILNSWFSPENIITIWLSVLLLVMGLMLLMPRLFKEDSPGQEQFAHGVTAGKGHFSYLDNLRDGYRYVSQSRFLLWMAASTFLLMALIPFLEYRTSQILLGELRTTQAISNFTGMLNGLTNLIALPIQLFLLSRIIGWIGVGNANLIFPIGNTLISSSLILWPNLTTAAIAYFDRNAFRSTFRNPPDNLLYNAVPLRVKGRARAFIGGLLAPIGGLIGGILLLLPFGSTLWFIAATIGVLAVAYLLSTFVIRQQYGQALIKMLEQEDYSFLLSHEASELTVSDPATLSRLQQKLEESSSHEFKVFMAKLISQVGGNAAVAILGQVAKTTDEARTRSAILDVLVAANLPSEAVRQLYTEFLADPDGRVRQSAISGLELLANTQDKPFLDLALKLLGDPEPAVRAQVLPILFRSHDLAYEGPAIQTLNEFLTHPEAPQRARGVRALQQTGDPRFMETLTNCLSDRADEVRLEAIRAIESLLSTKLPASVIEQVLVSINPLTRDPVERIRQASLSILGRFGSRAIYQTLITALTDASPQVRTAAVETLVQNGKGVIPIIHPFLDSPNPLMRKMTSVTLSRINRHDFGSLIETHITGNLLSIYRGYGYLAALAACAHYPSIAVLQSALREQNKQLLEEIFYLLSATHETKAIKIVADSLHSDAVRVRANAVEALESLTSPETAKLVAPLFEPEVTSEQLLDISKETWDMAHPNTVAAIKYFLAHPDDPWFRAMMTLALGEMGAGLTPPPNNSTQSADQAPPAAQTDSSAVDLLAGPPKPAESRSRRALPGNLFDALTTPAETPKPADEPAPRRPRPTDLLNALTQPAKEEPAGGGDSLPPARRSGPANLLGALMGGGVESEPTPPAAGHKPDQTPLSRPEIEPLIDKAFNDAHIDVRLAARAAKRMWLGSYIRSVLEEEGLLLSAIEKIIFLKEVPFFEGMTVDQLKVLANVCEEQLYEEDQHIFDSGDAGGALYVVISGRVAIEQEKRKGSFARIATIEAHSYFGEMNLFDNSPRSDTAIALQDTLTLRLRREPLIALARQYPDLSLELINVLSQRLREANDRVAELTRTRPRELHKLFDKFD